MTTFVDTETAAADRPAASTRAGGLYRAVWRWHFYAGLFVAPFIIMFAVTGLLYMFQPQIHGLLDGDNMYVAPQAAQVPYTEQVAAAEAAYPDATITQVRPPRAPDRATEVLLTDAQSRDLVVFVDPYTAGVTGERDTGRDITEIAITMHGDLLAGDAGDRILEIAAGWGVVLAATGVVLWWQRRPAGRLGAPAKPRQRHASVAAVVIMVAIGLVFPLVGVSLVAVLALDWLLISRIPVLNRALT